MSKYYDPHYIYIDSAVANSQQIHQSISEAIDRYCREHQPIITEFQVNVVANRIGEPFGYTYVRFTNPEVARMLAGLNPDGTERIRVYDDPNWKPAEKPIFAVGQPMSWADMVEEEEYEHQVCPQITEQLPSLMTLSGYVLSEEQQSQYQQLSDRNRKHFGHGLPTLIDNTGSLVVTMAYVTPVSSEHISNVLYSTQIPKGMSGESLKKMFTPYVTDPKKSITTKVNGKINRECYPLVQITKKNEAYVTFDPKTQDAQFARLMMRKTEIRRTGNGDQSPEVFLLIFDRAKAKTQRDKRSRR